MFHVASYMPAHGIGTNASSAIVLFITPYWKMVSIRFLHRLSVCRSVSLSTKNFWMVSDSTFVFHMYFPNGKSFSVVHRSRSSVKVKYQGVSQTHLFSICNVCKMLLYIFYAPPIERSGHIVLLLSVRLSVCTNLTWKLNIFPLLLN